LAAATWASHVAHHHVLGANVVADQLPDPLVAPPFLLHLDRGELQALGICVCRVDDSTSARSQRAQVEVVGGRGGETNKLAAMEDRHAEGDVGLMRGAVIGVVVDDHVSGLPLDAELGEAAVDPAYVAGDRTGLQRRRLRRLAQLTGLLVADHAAEVLRLADDRGE
jgi:hypothetical protein